MIKWNLWGSEVSGDRVDQRVSRPLREMGSEDFASQPCSSVGLVGAVVNRPVEGLMHAAVTPRCN